MNGAGRLPATTHDSHAWVAIVISVRFQWPPVTACTRVDTTVTAGAVVPRYARDFLRKQQAVAGPAVGAHIPAVAIVIDGASSDDFVGIKFAISIERVELGVARRPPIFVRLLAHDPPRLRLAAVLQRAHHGGAEEDGCSLIMLEFPFINY